mmetsp:Transcript_1836/g.7097  ORF Transcript_1836/g.7097 Transcript_1836/m.7097 type:complete len:221 (-) Transcript_1836:506-1168(-)
MAASSRTPPTRKTPRASCGSSTRPRPWPSSSSRPGASRRRDARASWTSRRPTCTSACRACSARKTTSRRSARSTARATLRPTSTRGPERASCVEGCLGRTSSGGALLHRTPHGSAQVGLGGVLCSRVSLLPRTLTILFSAAAWISRVRVPSVCISVSWFKLYSYSDDVVADGPPSVTTSSATVPGILSRASVCRCPARAVGSSSAVVGPAAPEEESSFAP